MGSLLKSDERFNTPIVPASMNNITIIVAATPTYGIGKNGGLPWRLTKEMKYFANVTRGSGKHRNAVIMGRKSWESIPPKFRPLPGRVNVVLTRSPEYDLGNATDSYVAHSLESALQLLETQKVDHTFLIGGAELYRAAVLTPSPDYSVQRILLTQLLTDFDGCDAFFPELAPHIWSEASEKEHQQFLHDVAGFDLPIGTQDEVCKISKVPVQYQFKMYQRS